MSYPGFEEYPKMLYRPGGEKSQDVWRHKLDTLIVNGKDEETTAVHQGWSTHPNQAISRAVSKAKWSAFASFFQRHWQFWVATIISILGLVAAFKAIK